MLKTVCVLCLTYLCFGEHKDKLWGEPECSDFDVKNCGLYYCIIGESGKCETDECFKGYFDNNEETCLSQCRKVTFDYDVGYYTSGNVEGKGKSFCVHRQHHFSDCALTASTLDLDENGDRDTQLAAMEEYCAKRQSCGGLYEVDINNPFTPYFYCAERDDDGTIGPDDFDSANCKYYEYIVAPDNSCIHDLCSEKTIDECTSSSCKIVHVDIPGEEPDDICTNRTDKITFCSSTFGIVTPENDECELSGCGPITDVKSIRGNVYYYCSNKPEPKGQGMVLFQHMPVVAILFLLIFIFFL